MKHSPIAPDGWHLILIAFLFSIGLYLIQPYLAIIGATFVLFFCFFFLPYAPSIGTFVSFIFF